MSRITLPRTALAALALVVSLSAAACGSDNKDSGLSNTEYVAKADPLCKRVPPQPPQTQDPKASAKFIQEKVIPLREQVLANVRKVEPNKDLQPKVDAYLASTGKVIALIKQQAQALAKGDLNTSGKLDVAIAQATAARNKDAAEVGFKTCGQPLQGPPVTTDGFESEQVLTPADAACKKATDATVATSPKNFEPRTLALANEPTLPVQKEALETLKSLETKATRPDYKKFVQIEGERYANALAFGAAGKANDTAEFNKVQARDTKTYEQGATIALRLGFTVCGVSSPVGF